MKKYLVLFITASIMLWGCVSSKKYLDRGQYDLAIYNAVKKIKKDPKNEKEVLILEKAYNLANQQNQDRIKYLNTEGRPERWDEIFQIFLTMKDRQEVVRPVMPLAAQGRVINFTMVDYDKEIVQAKIKAAEYYYNHAKELMRSGRKNDYRDAYYELQRAQSYVSTYQDAEKLKEECRAKGTSYALLSVDNETRFKLPQDFVKNLLDQQLVALNTEWGIYHNQAVKNLRYDYNVYIVLKIIDVSPESLVKDTRTESAKIQDGFEYILDERGNVRKDSTGKDLKQPKYRTIFCEVTQTTQKKAAHIEAAIEYENTYNKQVELTIPVAADNFFNYSYLRANGDLNALSSETRSMLNNEPVPFPADFDMIYAAGNTLKPLVSQALLDNRKFISRY